ncbi:MAG: ABC transporter permease [Chitinophagaceae bacterium]|nr:ABC transporter permease [Chitinophagaceae bacterium]
MNTSLFIARKLANGSPTAFSAFIIRLSTGATAIGVSAMIITVCFVNGFQSLVSQKIYAFWGHIRVQHYEPNKSIVSEEQPIQKDTIVEKALLQHQELQYFQPYATKSAVIDKSNNIEGILLKGVDTTYHIAALQPYIVSGKWISFPDSGYSKEIIISVQLAKQLNINLNDTVKLYFISDESGARTYRKLRVSGLYKTGIEEYDKLFCIGDLRLIQQMNNWQPSQIGGYEVFAKETNQLDSLNNSLLNDLPMQWMSRTIRSIYPNIFDWLSIQNVNRIVVFIIMGIVAVINMITCLLILILERTKMIGLLKAIGARDNSIMRIFLYYAGYIAIRGVLIGFLLGIGLCVLQQYTGFITLDESSYYVTEAPVLIIWWQILLICIATVIICYTVLLIPVLLIKKIRPLQALQFR